MFAAAEFDRLAELPENANKVFEYIGGSIVEVPSSLYASFISVRVSRRLATWIEDHNLGHVTGETGVIQRILNLLCER